ncbi:energy-coupling factor ABC transporter permease [Spiribacter insolitus]|uniref:Energy-coupling factor ABC transporter permease n=1 Tax=Spiribacter insolitus TaxID=3122417 RepID=A0ABV3T6T2_9GAMM
MNLAADSLPSWIAWGLLTVFGLIIGRAAWRAPWRILRANGLVTVFIAATALAGLLWSMQVGVREGLTLHLLGTASLVLVFGPALAMMAGAGALLMTIMAGQTDVLMAGYQGLLLAVLPVWVADGSHRLLRRLLPPNPFIFFLGSGFVGGMLALAAPILVSAALIALLGLQPGWAIQRDYLALLPLVLFPEGFINGGVMTALAVYQPDWVRSFDDETYLR